MTSFEVNNQRTPSVGIRNKAYLNRSPVKNRDFNDMLDMFDMGKKFGKKKKSQTDEFLKLGIDQEVHKPI